ncbi:coiled-coil domain-containing protein 40 [Strigomonas culicis]|nr:hypothetical protein STCU_07590 [Strigomonas culicis]EPY36498.1 coiled-coil domain-containing protein 40 [Strigomonas culicis]|eukprot:EPY23650.1 hypothetical protein STCU_07590 [Strigomonas culicis]
MSQNDEDVDFDSASDISEMDPESDILAPVQRRIEDQLRRHLQEITQQLHETNNEFTAVQKEREDCGVQLYNAQQQLAKLQETLEKEHEKHNDIQQDHEDKLKLRDDLSGVNEVNTKRIQEMQAQLKKHQDELTKLTETYQKVENFNEELKNQVALEKNAAHKTESDITQLERDKMRQDALVVSLQTQIHNLENQSASIQEQIQTQKTETKLARDTLAEAVSEMEAINMEKKQLVQQWRSSLIGMQRRLDALKKTEEALQQQKEDLQVLENEIGGYRRDIRAMQVENSKLTEFLGRVDNDVLVLEKQLDVLLDRRDKNAQVFTALKNSADKTDEENKVVEGDIKIKTLEVGEVEKDIAKHAKVITDMEAKVLDYLSTQTTLKQESQGALHDIEKIKAGIRAKELQVTQMENELARIRVDTLQARAYNETLETTLADLEKELQARGTMVDKMQQDIRRRNDDIDRKQKQLDQLNHQYEDIISQHSGEQGEHVGPLEATINGLSRAIAAKSAENEALQQEWIKLQTELVDCKNAMNDINEVILDSQSKGTILEQKKDRLLATISQEKQEIAGLQKQAEAMHLEMKRVNTLLNQNANHTESAANDAFLLENDLVRRLEERKREAIQLERKVDEVRSAKRDLIEDMMGCERDIMFWERKLQIARETEMALDPTIGRAEIEKMKKEITYMEQRMAQLQREQKFLIEEMQKLIDHRDIIRTKGQAVQQSSHNNKSGATRLHVEKENARLFKELSNKRQEAQAKERSVKEVLADVEKTASEVDKVQHEIEGLDETIENLQQQLEAARRARDHTEDEKQLRQASLQRLREAEKGTYKLTCYPEEAETEQARLEEGRRTVVNVMEELAQQFPELDSELQELMTMV